MKTQNPSMLLETQPIGKLLTSYSIPAIIGMVLVSLYNIIDSIYVGHGVGAIAISGLGIAFPLMNLLMALSMLIGAGGAAVCSIELGRKNMNNAFSVLGNVTILSTLLGIGFGILGLCFINPILEVFGASESTLPYAREFMQVILIGSPITFVLGGLNNLLRASGYPRKAMVTAIFSVVVNVGIAPVFIFILNWGIKGVALATVIAQFVSLLWIITHFSNKNSLIHYRKRIFSLQKKIILRIVSIGMAPFLMNVAGAAVVVVFNHMLWKHGGDLAIGAYGIVNRLLLLFAMIINGLSQGMQPIIGYNFGAQKQDRVRTTLKYSIITATVIAAIGSLVAQLFPELLAKMFTSDPELIRLVVRGLHIGAAAFFLVGAQIIISSYFQYIAMPKIAIFLSLTRQVIFLIPLLLILPQYIGLDGVWTSMPIGDSVAFVLATWMLWWIESCRKKRSLSTPPLPKKKKKTAISHHKNSKHAQKPHKRKKSH